jgi:hypothetical protein
MGDTPRKGTGRVFMTGRCLWSQTHLLELAVLLAFLQCRSDEVVLDIDVLVLGYEVVLDRSLRAALVLSQGNDGVLDQLQERRVVRRARAPLGPSPCRLPRTLLCGALGHFV